MAKTLNRVTLIGNVGKDPEIKTFANGESVANLSLATQRSWKDKQTGEWVNKTDWHRIVCYRKLAEFVSQYVLKGNKLFVEGSLQTREYEANGKKNYITEVIADDVYFMGERIDTVSDGNAQKLIKQMPQPQHQIDFNDDIPF